MASHAEQAFAQALHDIEQARMTGAAALNLSPLRLVHDGIVFPGNEVYRGLDRIPEEAAGIGSVRILDLSRTRIADLDPVSGMAALEDVRFAFTAATERDGELGRIALMEDAAERLEALRAHLAEVRRRSEPALPAAAAAPLDAAFEGDLLTARHAAPEAFAEPAAERRAREAWGALRDYHADLSGLLAGRNMPSLDRALAAFGGALGADYAELNVFALGTHGRRIARIAESADEVLLEDAAADLREFASAISLYLDRFEEWRSYLGDAAAAPGGADLKAARETAAELLDALSVEAWVEVGLPTELRRLDEGLDDAPGDPVVAHGFLGGLRNVVSAIGRKVLDGVRAARRLPGRLGAAVVSELQRNIASRAAGAITAAALGFLAAQSPKLAALAERLPAQFGWLRDLLAFLGVA